MKVRELILALTECDLVSEINEQALTSNIMDTEVVIENDFGDEEHIREVVVAKGLITIKTEE